MLNHLQEKLIYKNIRRINVEVFVQTSVKMTKRISDGVIPLKKKEKETEDNKGKYANFDNLVNRKRTSKSV